MTDKDKRFKSKNPVNYKLAKKLRENGVGQGLFTERALEDWKAIHKESDE